jgi:glutamine synthetase
MFSIRFNALKEASNRNPVEPIIKDYKSPEIFGKNVFGKISMREFLSKEAYESVISAIDHGTQIDRKTANQVASAMKAWASGRGATHYTHWFQPLTGSTAEKHDRKF